MGVGTPGLQVATSDCPKSRQIDFQSKIPETGMAAALGYWPK
jgi:hypothetical protein